MRAGPTQLFLCAPMDEHFHFRHPIQQVAAGVFGLPLSHLPHCVAHDLLHVCGHLSSARVQSGQIAQHVAEGLRQACHAHR